MSLTLRKRPGSPFWHARGTVPTRQADGTIARIRIEESTRSESKRRAREIAADLDRYYHELAYRPQTKAVPTFAAAALTYIQTSNRSDRFITALLRHFGETPIDQIDQAAVVKAAHELYPKGSPATHNRAVFTPVSAILKMAGFKSELKRPKIESKPIKIPDDAWFDAVLPVVPPHMAALIVFLTTRGRRVGEALALKREDVDWRTREVVIARTKNGRPVKVTLPRLCVEYLRKAPERERLFGYETLQGAHSTLKGICKRHKLKAFGFHSIGRRSFATRLLKQGRSIKHVQKAGGWESIDVLAKHYLHLEQSEVAADVEKVGEQWGRERKKARKQREKR